MKFYAVKKGRQPGVYRTWEAAKKQVDGYPNAKYKSFSREDDATQYLYSNNVNHSALKTEVHMKFMQ